ncbi:MULTISPECIES: hypothetical protein [Shewanella]|nr:hypothetical protein [Shewanella japonica]
MSGHKGMQVISYELSKGYEPNEYTNQVRAEIESLELVELSAFLAKFAQ